MLVSHVLWCPGCLPVYQLGQNRDSRISPFNNRDCTHNRVKVQDRDRQFIQDSQGGTWETGNTETHAEGETTDHLNESTSNQRRCSGPRCPMVPCVRWAVVSGPPSCSVWEKSGNRKPSFPHTQWLKTVDCGCMTEGQADE